MDELANAVDRNWGPIDQLRIEYQAQSIPLKDRDEGLNGVLVVDGRRRYVARWHGLAKTMFNDPLATIQFLTEDEWNVFRPYLRRYEVSKLYTGPAFTKKIKSHVFFEATGWWPNGDSQEPLKAEDGSSFFLRDVLRDPAYQVTALSEIEGISCHVVERQGKDRLYIDASRGVLVRRDTYVKTPPEPEVTYLMSGFREVESGRWLPLRIIRKHHIAGVETAHEIIKCELNGNQDDLFGFEPPPGTLVHDRDNDRTYQIPGGLDFFERLVGIGATTIEQNDVGGLGLNAGRRGVYIMTGLVLCIGVYSCRQLLSNRRNKAPRNA